MQVVKDDLNGLTEKGASLYVKRSKTFTRFNYILCRAQNFLFVYWDTIYIKGLVLKMV